MGTDWKMQSRNENKIEDADGYGVSEEEDMYVEGREFWLLDSHPLCTDPRVYRAILFLERWY